MDKTQKPTGSAEAHYFFASGNLHVQIIKSLTVSSHFSRNI
jgi:hypothetical protein